METCTIVSHLCKGRMLGLCLVITCMHELVNLILSAIYNPSWVCFDNLTFKFISLFIVVVNTPYWICLQNVPASLLLLSTS